ncbi:chromate transporter [Roseobacter denitrificans]|uniref:Chromate transporter n=1 Tax=Roseobacter denitrificans (strain ATCC 33942 / OCh 114) TaxID=375451 RepID=Q167I0_ROSDO|nr:chromate efflux transporter [Roseobacter denitrificans]ABG31863.1 chromate transporter [Roseobacter denitrificans OCh 114]AVL51419.1 chromate transporter [Roseobacter denitrificans]SFG42867.1 chromate transporter [Roseobacter denitrificans OCh 114]
MTAPTLIELCRVFARIGVLSFGGPAAQIALMHQTLVEEKKWLSEDSFLRALSLCMLLPGPEAMQLATYAGWRLDGVRGGLVAGLLFVLPGAAVILALALIYAHFGQVPLVQAAFTGIKAAVIIIVLQALLKLSRKTLTGKGAWALAAGAFMSLYFLNIPYPLIIATAAAVGALTMAPATPAASASHETATNPVLTLTLWGTLWGCPIVVLALMDHMFLMQIALFFSKLAVVSFGGAYAVLAYMTQTVVAEHGWITTGQMMDALGLAETTPGPLILVTQFVAMIAGFNESGPLLALAAGAVALWVTFTPCFLWIFLAGPYLDAIATRPRLSGALSGITAAVVGVILNLAVWFSIHVLFGQVTTLPGLPAPAPVPTSLDINALALTLLAAVVVLLLKRGIAETLGILAVAGLALTLL